MKVAARVTGIRRGRLRERLHAIGERARRTSQQRSSDALPHRPAQETRSSSQSDNAPAADLPELPDA